MRANSYGLAPVDLGLIELQPTEMMFWLYLPIRAPHGRVVLPPNVEQFRPIVDAALIDTPADCYIYLTAKTMYVSPECPGNRPGWHSDGFMTDDVNYIWYDMNPTLFWVPDRPRSFVQHHEYSLDKMHAAASSEPWNHRTYPCGHLLYLDESVIHRVGDVTESGVRTFVKVSVSRDRYDLLGNSINHYLDVGWKPSARRSHIRNHPTSTETA